MTIYDKEFYNFIDQGALQSANEIVPLILQNFIVPKTVIDFGCGTGAWLHTFKSYSADIIHGVDGSDEGHAYLNDEEFELFDLGQPYVPLYKYDLAISLEVAEHLPESAANTFVANVARCSDNILWSAAVPGQRGLNHINEQWPSYWIPKFEALGFKCNSEFRYQLWYNEKIENWYRQNILFFSKNIEDTTNHRDLIHYNNYVIYDQIADEHKYA